LEFYERAIALEPNDARLLYERDLLFERSGVSDSTRLSHLDSARVVVDSRDDLLIRHSLLLASAGRASEAKSLLLARPLHPWEGGEGLAILAWEAASVAVARRYLAEGRPEDAHNAAVVGLTIPPSLGEARLDGASVADVLVAIGDSLLALGRADEAESAWTSAAHETPSVPLKLFWNGVALLRLGRESEAREVAARLDGIAEDEGRSKIADYFATSVPTASLFGGKDLSAAIRVESVRALASSLRTIEAGAGLGRAIGRGIA
jgi:tetratricopeptide (TPR) repeat protein